MKQIHIFLNTWATNYPQEVKSFIRLLEDNPQEVKMNIGLSMWDMAEVYYLTTTEEDLKKENLEFLMNYAEDTSLNKLNLLQHPVYYPPYDPEMFGKVTVWYPEDLHYSLYLFVDENDFELLTNVEPLNIHDYEKFEGEQDKTKLGLGWYDSIDMSVYPYVPCLSQEPIRLPDGFIENITGKKMKYGDKPYKWQPVSIENLSPYKNEYNN
jgi:hypothetical protein